MLQSTYVRTQRKAAGQIEWGVTVIAWPPRGPSLCPHHALLAFGMQSKGSCCSPWSAWQHLLLSLHSILSRPFRSVGHPCLHPCPALQVPSCFPSWVDGAFIFLSTFKHVSTWPSLSPRVSLLCTAVREALSEALSCRVGGGQSTPAARLHPDLCSRFPEGRAVTFAVFSRHTCSAIRSTRPHRSSRRQGLQAGSPPPLPGTCRPGGCRAPGWPTPPAPRKTFSPATPRPRSSKRSARSSCGSRRSRAPCRTSTADRPRLPHLPSICFLWKQDWKESSRAGVCQRTSISWGHVPEEGSRLQF